MTQRKRISTYLTQEEQRKLKTVMNANNNINSKSAAIRFLLHLGYNKFVKENGGGSND